MLLRGADILVCQLGRLSGRPEAGLESPVNRQAGKPAPGVSTFVLQASSLQPEFLHSDHAAAALVSLRCVPHRSATTDLFNDCRLGHRHEGLPLVAAAFAVNHEDADQILLGINKAVSPITPAMAVTPRREQRERSYPSLMTNQPSPQPAPGWLVARSPVWTRVIKSTDAAERSRTPLTWPLLSII